MFGLIVWVLLAAMFVWSIELLLKWRKLKRTRTPAPLQTAFRDSFTSAVVNLLVFGGLAFLTFGCFLVRTIYVDHEQCIAARIADLQREASLSEELEDRRHNLRTTDPAFFNVSGTFSAFLALRRAIGENGHCEIKLTAPRVFVGHMPATIAMLASIASRCTTYGPMDANMNPDVENEATTGMVPNVVVLHMARNVPGGLHLYDQLSSLMPARISYDVPKGSPPNFVWFQFGTGLRWSSQQRTFNRKGGLP
jgi:hypothetical protein